MSEEPGTGGSQKTPEKTQTTNEKPPFNNVLFIAVTALTLTAIILYLTGQFPVEQTTIATPFFANATKNTCEDLKNSNNSTSGECYAQVAMRNKDVRICDNSSNRFYCITRYSSLIDSSACKLLENSTRSSLLCHMRAALLHKNTAICDRLKSGPPYYLSDVCKLDVVSTYYSTVRRNNKTGNWPTYANSACAGISSNPIRQFCLAGIKSDAGYCSKIGNKTEEDQWFRNRCPLCAKNGYDCSVTNDYIREARIK